MENLINIAVLRKKISYEQAKKEIEEIHKKCNSEYTTDLALRHYLEDQSHSGHVLPETKSVHNIHNFKE